MGLSGLIIFFVYRFPNAVGIMESPSQHTMLLIEPYFLQGLLGLPSKCTLTCARSFTELSRNFNENTPVRKPQPSAGDASEEKQSPGALVLGARKASLLEVWLLHLEVVFCDFRKTGRQYQQVQPCASRACYLAVAKPHLRKFGSNLRSER